MPVARERHVDLRHDRFGEPGVQRVVHDADDLERRVRRRQNGGCPQPRQLDDLPERRSRRRARARRSARSPAPPRSALFDVAVGEQPSGGQPDAERVRVVGVDLVDLHRLGARRLARRPRPAVRHVAQRVQPGVHAGGRDARDRAHPPQQLLEERDAARRIRIALRRPAAPASSARDRAGRRGRRAASPRTARISTLDPASSISDSATSATTSALRRIACLRAAGQAAA